MYIQSVFTLLALYVGLAHSFSWDIVVGRTTSTGSLLEFYNDGKLTHRVKPSNDIVVNWVSYDPIHKRVLVLYRNILTADSVLSFDLSTLKTQTIINKKYIRSISTIDYDPATGLFFGIVNKIIYSFLVKSGNDIDKNLVINLQKDDSVEPRDIVLDSSCGGYIYWTTSSNTNKIERVRFDGSKREVILDSSNMTREALTIDPQSKKMYWIEFERDVKNKFSILSADLNGKNIRTLYYSRVTSKKFVPDQLAVSKDFIYWGNREKKFFWQLPCNPQPDTTVEPNQVSMVSKSIFGFHGIATNYDIEEHAQGIPNCKATDSDSIGVSTDVSLLCVHGTKVSGEYRCECTQGYSGDRCDVSVCQNYCIHGDCKVSTEGLPKCSCSAGYSGAKCEVNACQGHCLNDGICSLDEDSEPVCQCTSDYEGDRCNVPISLNQCPSKLNTGDRCWLSQSCYANTPVYISRLHYTTEAEDIEAYVRQRLKYEYTPRVLATGVAPQRQFQGVCGAHPNVYAPFGDGRKFLAAGCGVPSLPRTNSTRTHTHRASEVLLT